MMVFQMIKKCVKMWTWRLYGSTHRINVEELCGSFSKLPKCELCSCVLTPCLKRWGCAFLISANTGLFIVCVCVLIEITKYLHITYISKSHFDTACVQLHQAHHIGISLRQSLFTTTKAIVPVLIPHSQTCYFVPLFLRIQLSQFYMCVFNCMLVLWECVWMKASHSSLPWLSL